MKTPQNGHMMTVRLDGRRDKDGKITAWAIIQRDKSKDYFTVAYYLADHPEPMHIDTVDTLDEADIRGTADILQQLLDGKRGSCQRLMRYYALLQPFMDDPNTTF